MINIKAVGLSSSLFSDGETRLGDAQIINDGTNYEVIDGYCGRGADRLIYVLKAGGIRSPYLHISHAHYDHDNGILAIINDSWFSPRGLYCYNPDSLKGGYASSEIKSDADYLKKVIRTAQAKGIPVHYVDDGDTIKHGEIMIKVYRRQQAYEGTRSDPHGWSYVNDGSLCYWFQDLRYLTTGDASMWAAYKHNLSPLIVKGGHHGNNMSADEWLIPSQMCPWLYNHGCRFYWDNDYSTRLTDFLMTGRDDAIKAGMTILDIHSDIDMTFACGKVTITHAGKTYTGAVPYKGAYTERWFKDSKGWWYRFADGTWPTGWAKLPWSKGPSWFLFSDKGYMLTGWQKASWSQGESWFYLDPVDGDMKTGWIFVDSCWYYLDPVSGAMQTGWLDYNDKKCYLEPVAGKNQGHCYVNCTAVIDGKSYIFDKNGYATEFDGSSSMAGITRVIDLSEHNDKTIDWDKVKSAGYGVIIRIGLRGSMKQYPTVYGKIRYDNNYKTYLDGIIKAGIPYSVYFFPTSISDAEADQEADWIRMNVADLALSMPVYLDSEMVDSGAGRADGLSKADRTRYLKRIIDKLKEAGIECGVYASTSWLNNKLDMSQLVGVPVWCAQYASKCTYSGDYVMWQYSSKASVPGINGNVDISQVMNPIPSINNAVDVMISIAQAEVGYHEGANNSTKYGNELHSIQPSNMDKNAAWCDAFVDWCVLQTCKQFGKDADTARAVLYGDFDDYTYFSVNLYKKAGRWTQTPARGYQIFFGGSGHTGIVTKVEGGKVYTIEGNKSDAVRECSYNIGYSNIIGYGMPRYDLI